MITEAELAQMKAWSENYRAHADYVNDVPRLIREVEALQLTARQWHEAFERTCDDTHALRERIKELRAALHEIVDMPHPTTHTNPYRMQAIARAALGEK